jgi:N-acetylglucosamine malate deacetylase 2
MVTDGAPRNGQHAERAGFAGAQAYADERARELREALALARVPAANVVPLGLADQTVTLRLAELTRTLLDLFAMRNIGIALTHAYEGGHPDHDAIAFAVHATARLSADAGQSLSVIEMPFYQAESLQRFTPSANPETAVRLSAGEQRLKRRMMDAHVTQRDVLRNFATTVERFRRAPEYDFTALPNNGHLFRSNWGLGGAKWLDLVHAARRELGLAHE